MVEKKRLKRRGAAALRRRGAAQEDEEVKKVLPLLNSIEDDEVLAALCRLIGFWRLPPRLWRRLCGESLLEKLPGEILRRVCPPERTMMMQKVSWRVREETADRTALIRLNRCVDFERDWQRVVHSLTNCRLPVYLDASGCITRAENTWKLVALIDCLPSLVGLKSRNNQLCDKGTLMVTDVMEKHHPLAHGLKELDLGDNAICSAGASLGTTLRLMTSLTHLNLRANRFSINCVSNLVSGLKQRGPFLTFLDLGYNRFGEESTARLACTLPLMTNLTHLNLVRSSIVGAAAIAVGHGIAALTSLKYLSLWNCSIAQKEMAQLCKGLKRNSSLTHLDLGHNLFGDSGAGSVATVVSTMRCLSFLGLAYSRIGDEGAGRVAEAAQHISLTRLDLGYNGIGPEGGEKLLTLVRQKTSIAQLTLFDNEIGPELTEELALVLDTPAS